MQELALVGVFTSVMLGTLGKNFAERELELMAPFSAVCVDFSQLPELSVPEKNPGE